MFSSLSIIFESEKSVNFFCLSEDYNQFRISKERIPLLSFAGLGDVNLPVNLHILLKYPIVLKDHQHLQRTISEAGVT